MGLDTTHGCWNGPYSSFSVFRTLIAASMGFDLSEMEGFCARGKKWSELPESDIYILLNHSDCDGEISTNETVKLLDAMVDHRDKFINFKGTARNRNGVHCVSQFMIQHYDAWISGLKRAIKLDEKVEFF